MTRAKDQLALIVPHRFYVHRQGKTGDKHLYASRTRFISGPVASHFDLTVWPRVVRGAETASAGSNSGIDLAARMRGRWQRTGT
jgi:DNA helicase-2/ATP-dependent DNA helicase PcrA